MVLLSVLSTVAAAISSTTGLLTETTVDDPPLAMSGLEKGMAFQDMVALFLDMELSDYGNYVDGSGDSSDFIYRIMASDYPTISEKRRIGYSFFIYILKNTDYDSSIINRTWEISKFS